AKEMSAIMNDAYSNGILPTNDDHFGWTKLLTDVFTGQFFDSDLIKDQKWHNQNGNNQTWLFTFTHRSTLSFGIEVDGWIPISHGAELPYLWFYPSKWETYNATDTDLAAADYMGNIWTNFAKNGKLDYPQAGEARNFIEIGDAIKQNTNWRATADDVFNKLIPELLGEFPPLKMSEQSWKKLRELGRKVLSKWNQTTCSRSS
ncbi:hypothetical protein PFISCL1PPCAC_7449, partial [Pristionchus fissidentatus]